MMKTYWIKFGRFANDSSFVRADSQEHERFAENLGFERATRKDFVRRIAWENAENAAWGSGRAVGHVTAAAYTDPTHPDYQSASVAGLDAWFQSSPC